MAPLPREQTLYAFAGSQAFAERQNWQLLRDTIIKGLAAAGFDVSQVATLTDDELRDRPAHYLFLYGNDSDGDTFFPFVVPASAVDDDLAAALRLCDAQTVQLGETCTENPELWRAWVKLVLASGLDDHSWFEGDVDLVPEDQRFTPEEIASLERRWEDARGTSRPGVLRQGLYDVRFVGACYVFEPL